ncbi:Fanconi anaemia protein FANCD2 [Cokeromyces recurvatus]|uniref:Fanconi anaemia protein FANCD2 n=1 Tax=Cokeromyces recurvatus TaxID=90255 RepID=UPI00221FFA31|nr:Fanconi anaemia protein FANCD2 [Cokeromyces recurvatus]KAI7899702.1 Fanconi anaemia protein FANCD2 [Cokeromyces recurvatus]
MLEELLQESGCQVDPSTVVFVIEPVLFRRKLEIKLRSQPNLLDEFLEDLQVYTQDPLDFRKFLLPSRLADSVPRTHRNHTSSTESLFKTLLAIDSLQPELITYLLERLPEFYDELENNNNSSSCTARLILHQLRWLDYIAQPEELTGKLIEIIQITPTVIQHEIITSLPDIINDSEHKPIVIFLKELMNDNPELTVSVLDALSNLTLHSESLDDVRETILDQLESAELDDLAVIIKFMLQTVTPNTVDTIIYGIRQKLDFRSLSKIHPSTQRATKHAPEAFILESIKLGLQFHKFVCDAWFKSIVALESQREHKVIDMLVLIILYSMTSIKKKVEGVIRKKIIKGHITASLIQETIMYHSDGLAGYWNTILSLSESLLRSCQQFNVISPCASTLYTSSFKSTDAYFRQEIIGALVTHIGSGIEVEMNIALEVLLQLVKTDVCSVIVYNVFIKGILDYLDNLSIYQIRTLFDIFSLLALTTRNPGDGSANLWTEIQTIIRKQLSSPREKYKNIGIIACLSAVKVLGSKELCNNSCSIQNNQVGGSSSSQMSLALNITDATLRHPLLTQATQILELALRYSKEYPNCIALIYDELAHMFSREEKGAHMDERLEWWVKENMASDFTEFYVVAIADALEFIEEAQKNHYLKLEPARQMNLDGEGEQIAIKMYELIYNPDLKKKKAMVVPMCSIFNLIQSCEKQLNNGSLVEIDALFGCSIIMFNPENLNDLSTNEIEYACDMLFYTMNWFRELLNAFMFTKEENYRVRIISRLRSILKMETLLNQLMEQVPNYAPLEFHNVSPTNLDEHSNQIISAGVGEGEDSMNTKSIKKEKAHTIRFGTVNEIKPYMRAFCIHILEIFKYNEELEDENEKMTFEEINYILEDLNQKIDIKITYTSSSVNHHFGKKPVNLIDEKYPSCNSIMLGRIESQTFMKKVVLYLPSILQTLENLYAELQAKDIEPGRIHGSEELVQAVSHIFNILYKLLCWNELQNSDNNDILKEFVHILANRVSDHDTINDCQIAFKAELMEAFRYLSNYGDGIPQATMSVLLFKILQRLMSFSDEEGIENLKQDALKVVEQIITTPWFDWRDIKKEIPFLFEQFIELNQDPLSILHNLVDIVLPEFEEEQSLEQYPLLKEETIVQHYQAIMNQIVKTLDLLKNTNQDSEIILVQNAQIVKIFERITNYVKTKEHKSLFSILLKTGRVFIEQFTKYSIPYFTKIFKTHTNEVVNIFKDFQSSTRMLQIICSHVKVLKEVQLASYVPPLKKALEIVIYQVKMLLTENRIPSSAFFMGALKHRDINGVEISSQVKF